MATTQASEISQQVQSAIKHHPHLDKNKLHINTHGGRVTLQGNVKSYFEKQMAQEALRNIAGVDEIENQLTVQW